MPPFQPSDLCNPAKHIASLTLGDSNRNQSLTDLAVSRKLSTFAHKTIAQNYAPSYIFH